MKLKTILIEKKNGAGVPIITTKSDINKMLKQIEKAEAELIKAKNMFSDMLPPARALMDKEKNSFFNYKRDHNSDVKRHNSNYTTEAEQHWENFKSSVNGSIVYSIGNVQKTIQQTKNSLKDLLKIV